jgi:uncharacterized membrane protein (DUF4010 family)
VTGEVLGLLVALGGGLLIGLERERRKRRGADRAAAGIRSFALAAFGGALAQAADSPTLVALGGAAVAALVAVAYARSRFDPRSRDPGLTTEVALFVTYLVGVLAVQQPPLGAGAAAVVALLLASRERLHRFATHALSDAEVHDAMLLAALALVALPLLPARPEPWLGGLAPRTLGLLAVLILALQAAGHVALRLFGAAAGLALSGLLAGFVSSTATIASMGARARAEPATRAACEAGAMLSTAATWVQALAMLAAVAPRLAATMAPAALAGAAVAAAGGVLRARRAPRTAPPPATSGPLRVREAVVVALLLGGVSLAVTAAQRAFGTAGALAGAALAALADAHAAVASLGALHAAGSLAPRDAALGVLAAVATNALSRSGVAVVAGGAAFGARVAASLAASTAAAAAAYALAA